MVFIGNTFKKKYLGVTTPQRLEVNIYFGLSVIGHHFVRHLITWFGSPPTWFCANSLAASK